MPLPSVRSGFVRRGFLRRYKPPLLQPMRILSTISNAALRRKFPYRLKVDGGIISADGTDSETEEEYDAADEDVRSTTAAMLPSTPAFSLDLSFGSYVAIGCLILAGKCAADISGPAMLLSLLIAIPVVATVETSKSALLDKLQTSCLRSMFDIVYRTLGEFCAFLFAWTEGLQYGALVALQARIIIANIDIVAENRLQMLLNRVAESTGAEPYDFFSVTLVALLSAFAMLGLKQPRLLLVMFILWNALTLAFLFAATGVLNSAHDWSKFTSADQFIPRDPFQVTVGSAVILFVLFGMRHMSQQHKQSKTPALVAERRSDASHAEQGETAGSSGNRQKVTRSISGATIGFIARHMLMIMLLASIILLVSVSPNVSESTVTSSHSAIAAESILPMSLVQTDANRTEHSWMRLALAGMITLSLWSSCLESSTLSCIAIVQLASNGLVYKTLKGVHKRLGTPLKAILFTLPAMVFLALFPTVTDLILLIALATVLVNIFPCLAILLLQYEPEHVGETIADLATSQEICEAYRKRKGALSQANTSSGNGGQASKDMITSFNSVNCYKDICAGCKEEKTPASNGSKAKRSAGNTEKSRDNRSSTCTTSSTCTSGDSEYESSEASESLAPEIEKIIAQYREKERQRRVRAESLSSKDKEPPAVLAQARTRAPRQEMMSASSSEMGACVSGARNGKIAKGKVHKAPEAVTVPDPTAEGKAESTKKEETTAKNSILKMADFAPPKPTHKSFVFAAIALFIWLLGVVFQVGLVVFGLAELSDANGWFIALLALALLIMLVGLVILLAQPRQRDDDENPRICQPRKFMLWVPMFGIYCCIWCLLSVRFLTPWLMWLAWLLVGLFIYLSYGVRNSLQNSRWLNEETRETDGERILLHPFPEETSDFHAAQPQQEFQSVQLTTFAAQ